jgi:diaminopimelate decarboxylase
VKNLENYQNNYAVKCNPCPYIVKTVLEKHNKEKDGFDCSSIKEIIEVLKLGGDHPKYHCPKLRKLLQKL